MGIQINWQFGLFFRYQIYISDLQRFCRSEIISRQGTALGLPLPVRTSIVLIPPVGLPCAFKRQKKLSCSGCRGSRASQRELYQHLRRRQDVPRQPSSIIASPVLTFSHSNPSKNSIWFNSRPEFYWSCKYRAQINEEYLKKKKKKKSFKREWISNEMF